MQLPAFFTGESRSSKIFENVFFYLCKFVTHRTKAKVPTHHDGGLGLLACWHLFILLWEVAKVRIKMTEETKKTKKSYTYHPQYGIVVMCSDEQNQIETFNRLKELGLKLKVVTV